MKPFIAVLSILTCLTGTQAPARAHDFGNAQNITWRGPVTVIGKERKVQFQDCFIAHFKSGEASAVCFATEYFDR